MKRNASAWPEEDVREMVRLFAEAGGAAACLDGRRRVLLEGLARWIALDGWSFLGADAVEIRQGRTREAVDAGIVWEGPGFRWEGYRGPDRMFGGREERIVSAVFRAASWLAGDGGLLGTPDRVPRMTSQRLAEVFVELIDGRSRKEIADRLGISVNTVSGYVREIYRLHGVKSQAMLVSMAATGNHADGS